MSREGLTSHFRKNGLRAGMMLAAIMAQLLGSGGATYLNIIPHRTVVQASTRHSGQAAPSWARQPFDSDIVQSLDAAEDVLTAQGSVYHRSPASLGSAFHRVSLEGIPSGSQLPSNSRLLREGDLRWVITPNELFSNVCDLEVTVCKLSLIATFPQSLGSIHDAVYFDGTIFAASDEGIAIASITNRSSVKIIKTSKPVTSIAVSKMPSNAPWASGKPLLAAGTFDRLYLYSLDGTLLRWEWTTNVVTESGGVMDDAVTSLLFAPWRGDPGALLIGNPTCLNVMYSNGTFGRISGDDGMPYGNITSMVATVEPIAPTASQKLESGENILIWFGTTEGVVLYNSNNDQHKSTYSPWHYFNGPRWLGGSSYVTGVSSYSPTTNNDRSTVVAVATFGGLTYFELDPAATLSAKAERFQHIAENRHNRYGMIAECAMNSYGDVTKCLNKDSDNNGLWTSLITVAMYMKHAVTGSSADADAASAWFNGMVLLNNVTGKSGLMARSCCPPDTYNKTCGKHTWIHDKEQWHPSSNADYKGWWWKGDTSSDEVAGHVFALSVASWLSPKINERNLARKLLLDIVDGIVDHGFNLIDITGDATTWGRWGPQYVNGYRGFSDERGLQSLQILAYLAAAKNISMSEATRQPQKSTKYDDAFEILTNHTNQYQWNVLNQKILAPCDDNYSDDELAWLPYFTWLFMSPSMPTDKARTNQRNIVLRSLARSWDLISSERSSLWSTIYYTTVLDEQTSSASVDSLRKGVLWNLQTWADELIDWPNNNNIRQDILFESSATRFNVKHAESLKSRPPLPANERRQYRWNANPYIVGPPAGTGLTEQDPGAWLLPYWMGRWSGLLSSND